jgi:hypothetical protein
MWIRGDGQLTGELALSLAARSPSQRHCFKCQIAYLNATDRLLMAISRSGFEAAARNLHYEMTTVATRA